MYIYIYIYIHVYIYICNIYIYTHTRARAHVCLCVCSTSVSISCIFEFIQILSNKIFYIYTMNVFNVTHLIKICFYFTEAVIQRRKKWKI